MPRTVMLVSGCGWGSRHGHNVSEGQLEVSCEGCCAEGMHGAGLACHSMGTAAAQT